LYVGAQERENDPRWSREPGLQGSWKSSTIVASQQHLSRNRWQATFSLIFRIGIDNERIDRNPAARIGRKPEGGGRVRFLSPHGETRLRAAIRARFPQFLPHLLLSIHTGMRMSEQYGLRGHQVDFERRQIHLLKTKNGDPRTIPFNSASLDALAELRGKARKAATDLVFPSLRGSAALPGLGWLVSYCA